MTKSHPLDVLFHPRAIAVIGATDKPDNWATLGFLKPLAESGFPRLFPVNLNSRAVLGFRAYDSVLAIPEPIDYALIGVPLPQVRRCLEECARKRVKFVCVYTAGFAETGSESGRVDQANLVAVARAGGMRLLGPNCIGVHCPESHISFSSIAKRQPGHVAFLSQSGRYCQDFLAMGQARGIRFSKMASYGNAADIDETDLLDYLGQDDETRVIASYLEGIRDGKRFKEVLQKVAAAKPVLILKGGMTEAGRRAARSHTGSLAGPGETWEALMRQTGAVPAGELEELSDLVMTFTLVPELGGVETAVVGAGGGAGVLACDALSRAGFRLSPFGSDIQRQLREFIPLSGTGIGNPVDFSPQTAGDPDLTARAVRTVGRQERIDLVLVHYSLGPWANTTADWAQAFCRNIIEAAAAIARPVVIVAEGQNHPETAGLGWQMTQRWIEAGLCSFGSLNRAAVCLGKRAKHAGLTRAVFP